MTKKNAQNDPFCDNVILLFPRNLTWEITPCVPTFTLTLTGQFTMSTGNREYLIDILLPGQWAI